MDREVIPSEYYEDPEMWALSKIDDVRGPRATPPLGRVRWEYLLLDQLRLLSHEKGNLFRIRYENLSELERAFWHAFMQKAAQKQEYRWELPDAITETLGRVTFSSDAPPLRNLLEDEAEYEEGELDEGPNGNQEPLRGLHQH